MSEQHAIKNCPVVKLDKIVETREKSY